MKEERCFRVISKKRPELWTGVGSNALGSLQIHGAYPRVCRRHVFSGIIRS